MDTQDMLSRMKAIIGDEVMDGQNDDLLSVYLDIAADKILNRRYPFRRPPGAEVDRHSSRSPSTSSTRGVRKESLSIPRTA